MTGWIDPDDAPEWGDDVFDRAEVRKGGEVVRPARGTLTKPASPIDIKPIPPSDDGLVLTTTDEVAYWAAATGHVMMMHRDGQMFRVTEPWESGEEVKP